MDGTGFRLEVKDVKKQKGFCAAGGIVEGRSISVNDYVCLDDRDGKKIRLYVAGIMVAPELEVRTAEPGRAVWIALRGRRANQIKKGDILKSPVKGRFRHSVMAELLSVVTGILLIANLVNIAVCLPLGWKDNISDVLRYSLIMGGINVFMALAVEAWDFLSRRRWKKKQQRDDWDMGLRVLKCSPAAYQLLILPAMLTVIVGIFFYQWSVEEPLELRALWERGELNQELFILCGLELLLIGSFVQMAWRKVFYSRHLLRVVCFGIARDILWTQVRSIRLFQDKSRARMILGTAGKRVELRSDVLSDGWGDFVDFTLTQAEEYGIPYELRQVQNVKRIKRSEKE